jgi:peroxiredoxin
LQRWQECFHNNDLDLQLVAISADTVAHAAKMKRTHGLSDVRVLSDASMKVADQFNLRHDHALTPKRGIIAPVAVPASILIDKSGIVRWIDRSDDYRSRIPPEDILTIAQNSLGDRRP